ncbi:hypothetical protein HBI17_122240 [Parastagonospora nodorum]|nr:hypothetical protein HBI17_122240 [Parastagonospora nodorum]
MGSLSPALLDYNLGATPTLYALCGPRAYAGMSACTSDPRPAPSFCLHLGVRSDDYTVIVFYTTLQKAGVQSWYAGRRPIGGPRKIKVRSHCIVSFTRLYSRNCLSRSLSEVRPCATLSSASATGS